MINGIFKSLLVLLVITLSQGLFAGEIVSAPADPIEFDDAGEEARYKNLTENFRCLVCQNQSVAASGADLAQDIRIEVSGMIKDGKSDQEVIDFLVARYGEFILYLPRFNATTFLLWSLPGILLILGLYIVLRIIKRRSSEKQNVGLNQNDEDRLNKLLGTDKQHTG
ncbi:MAG: cytochrome c maturation protein CcmH [Gammaproteobacteria bacterium]|nr:MAG: cytochrome c maturation protein CcmH [Gammaproteobacteria bacterium]